MGKDDFMRTSANQSQSSKKPKQNNNNKKYEVERIKSKHIFIVNDFGWWLFSGGICCGCALNWKIKQHHQQQQTNNTRQNFKWNNFTIPLYSFNDRFQISKLFLFLVYFVVLVDSVGIFSLSLYGFWNFLSAPFLKTKQKKKYAKEKPKARKENKII